MTARSVVADSVFRVRCSWWAPWAVLAAVLAFAGWVRGLGWWSLAPAAAGLVALAGHPTLRRRVWAGVRLWPVAAVTRHYWAGWMRARTGDPFRFTGHLLRQVIVGEPQQTPRIKRFERDGRRLVAIVESPGFFDQNIWRQGGDEIARGIRQPRPVVTIDRARREVRLVFGAAAAGLPKWTGTVPATLGDLRALPVARTHTGPAQMPLLGTHVLVTGATGSGKGSVIWSIVRELAPGVADGTVELWGADPKGGVELGMGRELFARFCGDGHDPAVMADMLEDAVSVMNARLDRMREQRSRLHEPAPGDPLIVVIVDEFLSMTAAVTDRAVRVRIEAAFMLLLSKGRAPGVSVVAAAQLAQKDALKSSLRDLLPTRVCLRVTDAEQVDMCLGASARKNGAAAHEIRDDQPGTGYMLQDGRQPVLVRFPWASDEFIRDMARRYPAPATTTPNVAPLAPAGNVTAQPKAPKLAAVEAELDALPAGALPDVAVIAERVGCTVRYVRRIIAERDTARNSTTGTGSACRNGVPSGDPSSPVKSTHVDTPGAPAAVSPDLADALADPALDLMETAHVLHP